MSSLETVSFAQSKTFIFDEMDIITKHEGIYINMPPILLL